MNHNESLFPSYTKDQFTYRTCLLDMPKQVQARFGPIFLQFFDPSSVPVPIVCGLVGNKKSIRRIMGIKGGLCQLFSSSHFLSYHDFDGVDVILKSDCFVFAFY